MAGITPSGLLGDDAVDTQVEKGGEDCGSHRWADDLQSQCWLWSNDQREKALPRATKRKYLRQNELLLSHLVRHSNREPMYPDRLAECQVVDPVCSLTWDPGW